MQGKNFEIIAAAQDTGGEAAAGQWQYDRAKATYIDFSRRETRRQFRVPVRQRPHGRLDR